MKQSARVSNKAVQLTKLNIWREEAVENIYKASKGKGKNGKIKRVPSRYLQCVYNKRDTQALHTIKKEAISTLLIITFWYKVTRVEEE